MRHNGEFIREFEQRMAEYTGANHAVAVDSGSNAIFLVIKYLGYTGEIDVPKQTYMSVPMSIINAGAKPIFKNVEWSGEYKLNQINTIDACGGIDMGGYVERDCFYTLSFQEKKQLSIGKGGMILTDDEEAAKTLRRMAFDGRDYMLGANEDDGIIIGYHMNMTPEQASKGLLKLNGMYHTPHVNPHGYWTYRDLTKMECFNEYV